MKKTKFPFKHIILEDKKEVWIKTSGSVTAIGIPALVNQYYPGYNGHIASEEYFVELYESVNENL
jgi:hypothetical protein